MIYKSVRYYKTKAGYMGGLKSEDGVRRFKSLHREIWKDTFGEIPPGYHVHHRDGNRSNNDINNLEIIHSSTHLKLHWKENREERIESFKRGWKNRKTFEITCAQCQTAFRTKHPHSKFCSMRCYRKKSSKSTRSDKLQLVMNF